MIFANWEEMPMSSGWGNKVRISLFGESHGKGIGVVIDGLPAGEALDLDRIREQMVRRMPGKDAWSTKRAEQDLTEILSGFYQGKTTGTPLTAILRNTDTHSTDYRELEKLPRPGHADLTGLARYNGANDPRGGGHFSARIMAPLTFAGAVCLQILERRGISITAHVYEIAGIPDTPYDGMSKPESVAGKAFPVLSDEQGEKMAAAIEDARMNLNSVGGVVECAAVGFPAGLGRPIFDNIESRLASILFGIPAVKGVEFGKGFAASRSNGFDNNDSPQFTENGIRLLSNNGGGVEGGISNGMPILVRCAFKPTSSIGREQDTINLSTGQNDKLVVKGRHDPCVVPRAVPIVESAVAVALLDILEEG